MAKQEQIDQYENGLEKAYSLCSASEEEWVGWSRRAVSDILH